MATTIETRAIPAPLPAPDDNYLNRTHGIKSWIFTVDHKRIGMMYLCAILLFFFVGGMFALGLRTELWSPGRTIMGPDTYNQFFTLHGAIMVFLVIIPGIPAALGNFVLPIMLGAKDVAFPRLNLWSFYLYITGAIFFLAMLASGGLDTGWTFYTPYSTSTNTNVVAAAAGAFILGFSSIFTGLNFLVTMHKLRPPGMTLLRMPLFLWSIYATAVIQVLATPVLGITLLLLIVERVLGVGIFDPALGGDPVVFQHFFWFYSHPAVYIMILPGMGIVSELITTFSRKIIFGYKAIAYSSIAIAIFSFLVWGHHMFVSGQSPLALMIFSALTFSVSIPSAVKVFNWLATMYKGAIHLTTPMCYALSFLFIFSIGGLTGLFLGALGTNVPLHDTYFIVAHFHYVMMGSALIAFIGGLHYWWPKMTGKMYSEFFGRLACAFIFIGFNLTFFTQFLLGTKGMPRRYWDYKPQFTSYHQISTIGAFTMAIGFFIVAGTLIYSLWKGRRAPANPWGASTLEWRCPSPPPTENFLAAPTVGDVYVYDDMRYDPETRGYYFPDTPADANVVPHHIGPVVDGSDNGHNGA